MSDIPAILAKAERRCLEAGGRLTPKRSQVLSCLLESKKAMSAYELQDYYRQQYQEAMPPMSVYRILKFLESERLVHRLNVANKYVACRHISCDHAHEVPQFLICDSCDRVTEISVDSDLLSSLSASITDAGYRLQTKQLEMSCRCEDCPDA